MNAHVFALLLLICVLFISPSDCWWRRRRRRVPACQVSGWGTWGACSRTCDYGTRTRKRHVTRSGQSCPSLSETVSCRVHICCKVSGWGTWGACSKTCDYGTRTRIRHKTQNGVSCPSLSETASCRVHICCKVSGWGTWGACSRTCEHGTRTRKRHVTQNGYSCPSLSDTASCRVHTCCQVSSWSIWGTCSATCDSGKQKRTRSITKQPSLGGTKCPLLSEDRYCQIRPCVPVDCEVDQWSEFSHCSKSCGHGSVKMRQRVITKHPKHGGKECPATTESVPCEIECPINCSVSVWTSWTACSATCEKGTRSHHRTILEYPMHGGKLCPKLHSSEVCDSGPCPVDCEVGSWSIFEPCSKTCGHGFKIRRREIVHPTEHGGDPCPVLEDKESCLVKECPVDCEVFAWGDYGSCDVSCGNGTKTRTRTIKKHPAHGGHLCPSLVERIPCLELFCPVDCKVNSWSEWTQCKGKCGSEATQVRIRNILREPSDGGKACPTGLKEKRACNTEPCPVNCRYGIWSRWSACSSTCGSGRKTRTRQLTPPKNGGKKCWSGRQTKYCKVVCPKCQVSDWSLWSKCEGGCKWAGREYRTREVTSNPANKTCPKLKQGKKCFIEC